MSNEYKNFKHVVKINSNIGESCNHCAVHVGNNVTGPDSFAEGINHYIQEHGYTLLHVGSETTHADGGLWHSTVAVLGR